jgi:hypothetical protein
MKRRLKITLLFIFLVLLVPGTALAQTYYFSVDSLDANVFWNDDGTADIEYVFNFTNLSPDSLDFVDVGMPNGNYSLQNATAQIDGKPLTDISSSPYVTNGVAVGLGSSSIPSGQSGSVQVLVKGVERVLFQDDKDPNYASAVFSTTYFDKSFVSGTTDTTVTFHLPPGVQPDEPRWHSAPSGFPSEPQTGFDSAGRITYTWENPNANAYNSYQFGASFPKSYVPASAVYTATIEDRLQIPTENLVGGFICVGFIVFFFGFIAISIAAARKRQLQYLPPKIAIEGNGIKRGLTAIEAAILMEQPMDKILTMILFAVVKKNAAQVTTRDPLELKVVDPLPQDLRPYEVGFLQAFSVKGKARRKAMQDVMVDLVKSVSGKMKGFSRKETIRYYEDIVNKAWAQVEAGETPEVANQKFDENMEWTMLDRDFNNRTQEVFRTRPIFVPVWWGRFDPTYSSPTSGGGGGRVSAPSGGGMSMPTLPGATFAASVATSIQNFSSNVVGNLTEFTSGVTNKTNPIPKSTSSGGYHGGGGGGCACACACAGCACACAGGGR